MDALGVQDEINSLARDIQARVTLYLERTGHTHKPLVHITYMAGGEPEYIGHEPEERVCVTVTGTLSAIEAG